MFHALLGLLLGFSSPFSLKCSLGFIPIDSKAAMAHATIGISRFIVFFG